MGDRVCLCVRTHAPGIDHKIIEKEVMPCLHRIVNLIHTRRFWCHYSSDLTHGHKPSSSSSLTRLSITQVHRSALVMAEAQMKQAKDALQVPFVAAAAAAAAAAAPPPPPPPPAAAVIASVVFVIGVIVTITKHDCVRCRFQTHTRQQQNRTPVRSMQGLPT